MYMPLADILDPRPMIVNGSALHVRQLPWLASLQDCSTSRGCVHFCSGTLVSRLDSNGPPLLWHSAYP